MRCTAETFCRKSATTRQRASEQRRDAIMPTNVRDSQRKTNVRLRA